MIGSATTGAAPATTASTPPATRRTDRWLVLGLLVVVLAPIVALVVTRTGRPYLPVQDFAINDLRVRDVFTSNVPLVGPYSRYGWSHPGPLVFWLVAPLSRLFGSPAWATQLGFALLQAVAIVWTVVLAWRRRGLWAAAMWMTVMALGYLAVGQVALLEAWGPHVALPFFVLFCCQVWLLTPTTLELVPQAVAVASLLVQTHIGYVPLVLAGAIFIVVAVRRGAGSWRQVLHLRPVQVAIGIAVVLWIPVILDTVLHPPGNLAKVVHDTVLQASEPKVGVGTALGLLAAAFRPVPAWLGGTAPLDGLTLTATPASTEWLLVPVVVCAAAGYVARRTGDVDGQRLVALTAAMLGAGVVALASVQGATFPYLFYWRDVLGALTIVTGAAVAIRAIARTRPVVASVGTAAALAITLVAIIPLTADVATAAPVFDRFGPATQDLVDQLAAAGQPAGAVLIRPAGDPLGGVEGGIFDELARRGADVRVDADRSFQFGQDRGATPSQVSAIWYVVEESDQVSLVSALPGAHVVAQHRPLPDQDLARLTDIQRELAAQLHAQGRDDLVGRLSTPLVGFALDGVPGVDRAEVDELSALNERIEAATCECAVISVPPSEDGPVP
jgi:hypothetical protein